MARKYSFSQEHGHTALTHAFLFQQGALFFFCRASRIVAVVGAGHLPGMRDQWDAKIDLDAICTVPEKRQSKVQWGRLLVVSAATGSLFWYGTMLRRR